MENEENIELDASEAVVSTLPKSLSEDYRSKMGKLLELNDAQKKRLKKWLKKRIEEWESDTAELHRILEEDNDLVEGYVDEPSDIYQGWGSNVHVDVTGIYMEVFQSIEKRSILSADTIWYAETDNPELWDFVADLDTMLNQKARNEWNIEEMVPMAIWAKNRDGLSAVKVTWEEEYEKTKDVILITSSDDFMQEFPTPDDAGLEMEEWQQLQQYVSENASEETPVEIPITFEKRTYYGNKAEVVELIDFVTFPATVKTIYGPSCRGYGMRFKERKEEIKKKIKDEVYYEDEAKSLIKKGNTSEIPSYTQSQDYIEGLKRTNTKDDYGNFELVVKGSIDGDDGEEGKYLVVYNKTADILLRCIDYPYRVDFYALFTVNKKPNRLIGKSVPSKTRDMNDEIDTQHNQRINARTITNVPSFIADPDSKKEWDPKDPANRWKPGIIVYTTKRFDQLKLQPVDLGESMAEENNDFRILDLSVGAPASLFSGQASIGDPNAPGNKTAMMIQQGNMRMDDPLMEDREGIDMLGNICLSHLYQFGPAIIQFTSDQLQGGKNKKTIKTIHKKYLRTGINMRMKGITIIQNPDAEMAKKLNVYGFLSKDPIFMQYTKGRVELLRDALKAGREVGRDKYLPPMDQIEQEQIDIQKKAMVQMAQQQQAAQQQQKEQLIKGVLLKAKQAIDLKKTQNGLVENGVVPPIPPGPISPILPSQNGGMQ